MSSVAYRMDQLKSLEHPPVRLIAGFLLVALHYGSYFQYYIIMGYLLEHDLMEHLVEHGNLDSLSVEEIPGMFWRVSGQVFEFSSFLGGIHPRIQATNFKFNETFVQNPRRFSTQVDVLVQILSAVNNESFLSESAFFGYLREKSKELSGLGLFKLQFFVPLAALCGLVRGPALKYADMIEPAEGASGGSHTVLSTYFQPHQFSYVLRNICSEFGLQRREMTGECITCEGVRKKKRFELYFPGQSLFHLFWDESSGVYSSMKKLFGTVGWIPQPFYED